MILLPRMKYYGCSVQYVQVKVRANCVGYSFVPMHDMRWKMIALKRITVIRTKKAE
jgi:hypothetical protein